jgi:hypothetical protein
MVWVLMLIHEMLRNAHALHNTVLGIMSDFPGIFESVHTKACTWANDVMLSGQKEVKATARTIFVLSGAMADFRTASVFLCVTILSANLRVTSVDVLGAKTGMRLVTYLATGLGIDGFAGDSRLAWVSVVVFGAVLPAFLDPNRKRIADVLFAGFGLCVWLCNLGSLSQIFAPEVYTVHVPISLSRIFAADSVYTFRMPMSSFCQASDPTAERRAHFLLGVYSAMAGMLFLMLLQLLGWIRDFHWLYVSKRRVMQSVQRHGNTIWMKAINSFETQWARINVSVTCRLDERGQQNLLILWCRLREIPSSLLRLVRDSGRWLVFSGVYLCVLWSYRGSIEGACFWFCALLLVNALVRFGKGRTVFADVGNVANRAIQLWTFSLCVACTHHLWQAGPVELAFRNPRYKRCKPPLPSLVHAFDNDKDLVWAWVLVVWFQTLCFMLSSIKKQQGLAFDRLLSMSGLRRHGSGDDLGTCEVCGDEKQVHSLVTCPSQSPHFFCTDCFSMQVKSQVGELGAFAENGQRIYCSFCNHAGPVGGSQAVYFDQRAAVQSMDIEALEAFYASKQNVALMEHDQRVNREYRAKEEAWRLELRMGTDAAARNHAIHIHVQHVKDNILTYKCPSCNKPFFPERGDCSAIKCECNTYFCGWCLVRCDNNEAAHDHVRRCTDNPTYNPQTRLGNLFANDYDSGKRVRIGRLVTAYLDRNVERQHREAVKRKIRPLLRNFGVQV